VLSYQEPYRKSSGQEMSVRLCSKCKKPCAGHVGPYGAGCTDPDRDDSSDSEEKPPRFPVDTSPVTRTDFEGLVAQIEVLSSAVKTIVRERIQPLSSIISPGRVQPGKLNLNLPPPSWPRTEGVKTEVTQPEGATGGKQPPVTGVTETKETTQSLARNRELAELLKEYNSGGIRDLLSVQEASATTTSKASRGESSARKVLLIPDFINYWDGLGDDEDDTLVTTKGKHSNYKTESDVCPQERCQSPSGFPQI
jgi:hypothetical protein